jgi:hypothetical protein
MVGTNPEHWWQAVQTTVQKSDPWIEDTGAIKVSA